MRRAMHDVHFVHFPWPSWWLARAKDRVMTRRGVRYVCIMYKGMNLRATIKMPKYIPKLPRVAAPSVSSQP